jgi:hypothetical protein
VLPWQGRLSWPWDTPMCAISLVALRTGRRPDCPWWNHHNPQHETHPWIYLLYLSTSLLWWQAVAGPRGVQSSHALRRHARRTWQHREGARNVYNTAIRRARSPLRPGGSVTAGVHGCPRGVAPLRHPIAIRANPVAHTGGATTPSPHRATGGAAHPPRLFSPPGHGLATPGCSSEALDMTAYERNRERGRQ